MVIGAYVIDVVGIVVVVVGAIEVDMLEVVEDPVYAVVKVVIVD